MSLTFNPDEDTINIIDKLVRKFLVKYFLRSTNDIDFIINRYVYLYEIRLLELGYNLPKDEFFNELFHHDHPYHVAANIHYQNSEDLRNKYDGFKTWLMSNNIFQVPNEAQQDYLNWVRSLS